MEPTINRLLMYSVKGLSERCEIDILINRFIFMDKLCGLPNVQTLKLLKVFEGKQGLVIRSILDIRSHDINFLPSL